LLGKKIEPMVVDPASNGPLFTEKARELRVKDKVAAVFGCWTSVSRKSPSGFEVVTGSNHHMAKPVMIGEVQANGQFSIVHSSKALPPKAWSRYVEANKGKVADWSWPWVCGGCTSPRFAAN
jgi:hypothetical protein